MRSRHFIDDHLNFKRMFGEAIRENVRDHYDRSLIQTGYFLIRLDKSAPLIVPARIYERPPDDGDTPAGEILGEPCDPVVVWKASERQALIPPDDGRAWTVDSYYRWLCADAEHAKEWRRDEPIANPRKRVDLATLPPIPPPTPRREK